MMPDPYTLAFLSNLGPAEMIVIGILALLIFGRRLPEVGRSVGRSIVEFKKGLRDAETDVKSIGGDIDKAATPKRDKDAQAAAEINDPKASDA